MSTTSPPRRYTLAEAAERCGYRRKQTFRERFLRTDDDYANLGFDYDARGRAVLDADAVDALALRLNAERAARGNWRARNLGEWARKRNGD